MRAISILMALVLTGCAGQNIYIPIATAGRDKQGNPTSSVKSVPLFKNTGNLANANFQYRGMGGSVSFTADVIDNATATMAIGESTSSIIRSGGSVIGTAMAGMAGIVAAQGLTETAIATTNAGVSKHAATEATKRAGMSARAGVASERIAAKVATERIGAAAATKALRIDAARAIRLGQ